MATRTVTSKHVTSNGRTNGTAATLARAAAEGVAPANAPPVEGVEEAPVAHAPVEVVPPTTVQSTTMQSSTVEPEQTEEPKTPAVHSAQMEEHYLFIGNSDNFLKGLRAAPEPLASLLVANRITPERLTAANSLLESGQGSLITRSQKMLDESAAVIAMQRALGLTEIGFSTLRQVGRTVFGDEVADRDSRRVLGLDEKFPPSNLLLLEKGPAVLGFAKQEPQASRLAAVGYDEERIDELLALFAALDLLYDARQAARQEAINATRARDETMESLRTVIRQLRLEVTGILRAHPEVNPPAGF